MSLIQIKDKQFEECFSKEDLEKIVNKIVYAVKHFYVDLDNLLLVGVLEGARPFLKDLSKKLNKDTEVDYIKVSSYGDSLASSGKITLVRDCAKNLQEKDVLIVEDIVETGQTQAFLLQYFKSQNVKSVKICSLFYKSIKNKTGVEPDFYGKNIPDDFIVGYGLDYAQEGRELSRIYKLIKE